MWMTPEDSEAKVVMENNMTECFNVIIDVIQGDALSVMLFNLVLDYIMKKLFIRGKHIS
jgi:hypothetical protein